jgi:hypothetical protein
MSEREQVERFDKWASELDLPLWSSERRVAWAAWQAALAQPAAPAPDAATADQIMALADAYAHVYSFVHDNTMALARATLRAAVEQVVAERDALKAQPAAQAVPLTLEQINALPEASVWWPCSIRDQVMRLIRAVERAHGIGTPEGK